MSFMHYVAPDLNMSYSCELVFHSVPVEVIIKRSLKVSSHDCLISPCLTQIRLITALSIMRTGKAEHTHADKLPLLLGCVYSVRGYWLTARCQ